ncbi:MAG: DUF4965 domain-containing protein [Kiritimatiellae bacterium]|nr:DUF4965 domain-containing protein [Kiritimatiellia bacterium]
MNVSFRKTSLTIGMLVLAAAPLFAAFRPPAVPLVCVDPFFSVWSRADKLTETDTTHWSGARQAMTAQITVDGQIYRLMGTLPEGAPSLPQTACEVRPTQTLCRFSDGTLDVELIFSTPAMADDLDAFSRPVTYVTFRAKTKDGKKRTIRFDYALTGEMTTSDNALPTAAGQKRLPDGTQALWMGRVDQTPLSRSGDQIRCDWGYVWMAAPKAEFAIAAETLPASLQRGHASFDFGSADACQAHLILAYDDVKSIMFCGRPLSAWWARNGLSFTEMLVQAEAAYPALMKKMDAFDAELMADLKRVGGDAYAAMAALAYRQTYAACKLVADPNGQPLYFSKENASNGCIATVDITYPQIPQLLLMSPTLTRATLAPILIYASDPRWKFPFAPHDIGQYPLANGQRYGGGERTEDNQMPVEESGNMLICLGALSQLEKNADFASDWWPLITKWAEYLADKGFDPANQLCTDDFAGHLAHNANLSIKAIMGLASYAKMAGYRGEKETEKKYMDLAASLVPKWLEAAKGGKNGGYRLAFDRADTWSMKYNLVWDRILGFNLFPKEVAQKEMAAYRQLLQPYGLPLDNRKAYTKVDWTVWTATLTGNRDDFDAIINALARFVNETPDRIPFSDWYWADSGKFRGFIARAVIGGVFLPMLYDDAIWNKYAARDRATTHLYAPLRAKTAALGTPWVPEGISSDTIKWKYTTEKPAAGWEQPGFDDSGWKTGIAGFGAGNPPGSVCKTPWNTRNLWVRRHMEVASDPPKRPCLFIHHDEDATVYFNGVKAGTYSGYTTSYVSCPTEPQANTALKKGSNLLAASVSQTMGGQYLDFGIYALPEPITFNLASFNIRCPIDKAEKAWTNRAPFCVKLIKARGIDLLGVQEATPGQIQDLRAGLPEWDHVGLGREKGNTGEATAILFKKTRFDLLGTETFWLSEHPNEPGSMSWKTACTRVCTWAHLRDKLSGKTFYYFNTHLDHVSAEARSRGMALILKKMQQIAQGETVFLSGDMNATANDSDDGDRAFIRLDGPVQNPISLAKAVLFDSFETSETPHTGPVNTFTNYGPKGLAKIDYIFTTGNVRILSHATCDERFNGLHPSDHDPVVVKALID